MYRRVRSGIAVAATLCSLPVLAQAENLHLVCFGSWTADGGESSVPWHKEIIVDLAESRVLRYDSDWGLFHEGAETSSKMQVDGSTLSIMDVNLSARITIILNVERSSGRLRGTATRPGFLDYEGQCRTVTGAAF